MSYKTILVHVDDARNVATRIDIAAQLALSEDAHLIGTAMTGVSRFLYESVAVNPDDPNIIPYLDTLRKRAANTLTRFEEVVQRVGVRSFEKRLTDDEPAGGISQQAHYCDLVVLGQYDPEGSSSSVYADVPEYVVLHSGCPVLLVPYSGSFNALCDRVLVAWNGSMEAISAVRDALPLLQRAKIVEVVIFNPSARPEAYGAEPGADIALYLARHGVKIDVMQERTDGDVGEALLSLAANLNSTLMVMGCYGTSRFREVLLGGATRTMLQSMTIPVLMSH
jgi:nucleotide-binding universal stress UspA family protein